MVGNNNRSAVLIILTSLTNDLIDFNEEHLVGITSQAGIVKTQRSEPRNGRECT